LPSRPLRPPEHLEQVAHFSILDERVPQRELGLDLVAISPAMSLAQHIALVDKLGEHLVGTALRDADRSGDVTQADPRVLGDAKQDVSMVCEEIPATSRTA
jgi:hypothetical protein